jgi:L-ascorbate metabolism protein UlaG (beta-lactamase superfamily)
MAGDDLNLTLIGGPTLLIEWQGLRLLTDPTFDPAGGTYGEEPVILRKITGPAVEAQSLGSIHAVLLSHDQHDDNLDRSGRALLPSVGRVLTTEAGASRLGGNATGLAPWGSTDLTTPDGATVRVVATPARHGPAGIEPLSGDVTGFVLQLAARREHGVTAIYVSGDTVWYEGVAEVARRFPQIGVAILHLGAAKIACRGDVHLTMNTDDAVAAAQAFQSAIIVPIHYEGWTHFSQGRQQFVSPFAEAGLERRITWLAHGVRTAV